MSGVIRFQNFTKNYNGVKAVDSLNLEVSRGEVFGFLGPNGAGKTTSIKGLMGLLRPTSGRVLVNGETISTSKGISSSSVGYLPEVVELWDNLTGVETLTFMCHLKNVDDSCVTETLKKVGLGGVTDRKVNEYSKGMRQRLALAQSLLGEPELLILDEPSSGLDPAGVALVKDIIRAHVQKGGTVFLSSHILPVVEDVAHRVGIIVGGRLRTVDSVPNLRDQLEIPSKMNIMLSSDYTEVELALKNSSIVKSYSGSKNMVTVTCGKRDKKAVLDLIEDAGTEIMDFGVKEGTLEDIFLSFSGGEK